MKHFSQSWGWLVLLATFVPMPSLSAQDKPPVVRAADSRPSVDMILEKYVQALGGKEAIQKLTSRVRRGSVEMQGVSASGSVERYQKAPNKLMSIQRIPGYGIIQTVFNGSVAWYQRPEVSLQQLKGRPLADLQRQAEFYWPLKLKEIFPKMTLRRKEKVGGYEAYVIEAIPAEGSPEELSFDTQSGLLIRQAIKPGEGLGTVVTRFEDYREVDGVKLPHTIRQGGLIIRYTEVKHNVLIDESKFDKPAPQ